jgi:hypothetical protein
LALRPCRRHLPRVGRKYPAKICALLQGFEPILVLRWSEPKALTESAVVPPSIKGLGSLLQSVEVKLLPPRRSWWRGSWQSSVMRCLCFLRRPWRRCVHPLPLLVQVGDELGVMLLFCSGCPGSMVEATSAWVAAARRLARGRDLFSSGLRRLAPCHVQTQKL